MAGALAIVSRLAPQERWQRIVETITDADRLVVRSSGQFPANLSPGAKVLTVTIMPTDTIIRHDDLTIFDVELRWRGYQVEHLINPRSDELRPKAQVHDAVFVNVYVGPMMNLGTVRVIVGSFGHWGWRSLFTEHPHVFYTSFGSPYLAHELPHVPDLMAAYGGGAAEQRAAVKVWLGEVEPQSVLPVQLPKVEIRPCLPGAYR